MSAASVRPCVPHSQLRPSTTRARDRPPSNGSRRQENRASALGLVTHSSMISRRARLWVASLRGGGQGIRIPTGSIVRGEILLRNSLDVLYCNRADTFNELIDPPPAGTYGFRLPHQHGMAKIRILPRCAPPQLGSWPVEAPARTAAHSGAARSHAGRLLRPLRLSRWDSPMRKNKTGRDPFAAHCTRLRRPTNSSGHRPSSGRDENFSRVTGSIRGCREQYESSFE